MAENSLLKRQLSLLNTAFVNRQCKLPAGHQRLMKSSVALILRIATVYTTSEEFCAHTLPDSK